MKLAYVRVSTKEQNEARQMEALRPYGIEKVFEEKISGKKADNRPELQALKDFAREGDTIYIESISRLARNTLDFLQLVEFFTDKGVNLISLKESIDTSTPQGKFMVSVFAALSQLELETIRQRQREGIDIALAEGRPYGRPKAPIDARMFRKVYQQWKDKAVTVTQAAKILGVTRQVFYRRVQEMEGNGVSRENT